MRKVELLVTLCLSAFRSGYVNHGRTSRGIEPEYLTKSNPPILDSLSNDSKRSSSKWSRYMAERPKATSLPVTQLRWITSVTGSLIPLLLLNYCNKIRVKYRVSHTSPIGAQFRCSPTFPAGWPDLDPHAADRRCSPVSECTQNTLLRFLLDEECRTSGRLVPKCLQGQGMSVMVEHHVNWTWYLANLYLTAWATIPNETGQNEAGTWLSVLKPHPFQWPSFVGSGSGHWKPDPPALVELL